MAVDYRDRPGNEGGESPCAGEPFAAGWRMVVGYAYILASKKNGTLYTGVTKNLPRRVFEHQNGLVPGFSKKYDVKKLVWFEKHDLVVSAIQREKSIKKYPRQWKINLIEEVNPEWRDLTSQLLEL